MTWSVVQQFGLPRRQATVEIRLHRATVAGLEPVGLITRVNDLDAELVPEHARVVEEGLLAREGMQIGAAHADAVHAHERGARRSGGFGPVDGDEVAGVFEGDGQHG